MEQREESEIKVPDIAESILKEEESLLNPVAMPKTSKLPPPGKSESATNIPTPSLVLPKDISGKIEYHKYPTCTTQIWNKGMRKRDICLLELADCWIQLLHKYGTHVQ